MASVVEICNRALSNIGNSRSINSLTEASKEAGECSLHFEACRDALLKLCFLVYAIQQQQCAFSTKLVQTPTEQES